MQLIRLPKKKKKNFIMYKYPISIDAFSIQPCLSIIYFIYNGVMLGAKIFATS